MPSDSDLLDLIEESVLAQSPARRRAAKLILEALWGRKTLDGLNERIFSLDLAQEIREQADSILAKLGCSPRPEGG